MPETFALLLHSHIPYCRKSGVWPAGEEWLFEALNETYLPLLRMLRRLTREGVRPALLIGVVPILMEQLADPYLQGRFVEYLKDLLARAANDRERFQGPLRQVADYWRDHLHANQKLFCEDLEGDVLGALRQLQQQGHIEVLTSAATHGLLPLLSTDSAISAQVRLGVDTYRKFFSCNPKGFWLPECGYRPETQSPSGQQRRSVDSWLAESGIQYCFVESSALEQGSCEQGEQEPPTTFQGYRLPSGVVCFGRDAVSCRQVWSADQGYPGDPQYLEFHAKDSVSGLRYWRVTGRPDKEVYDPDLAQQRVKEHARHFASLVAQRLRAAQDKLSSPVLVNPYDCELFGHWWHEGVAWLEQLCLEFARYPAIERRPLGELIAQGTSSWPRIRLQPSTWGENGDFTVWRNPEHGWLWPYLDDCGVKFESLARQMVKRGGPGSDRAERLLKQLGRELLLLQGSDWPFLLYTKQAKEYANHRFHQHHQRFLKLLWAAKDPDDLIRLAESDLVRIEDIDCPWQDLDWRLFAA